MAREMLAALVREESAFLQGLKRVRILILDGRLCCEEQSTRGVSMPILPGIESTSRRGGLLGWHVESNLGWHRVRPKVGKIYEKAAVFNIPHTFERFTRWWDVEEDVLLSTQDDQTHPDRRRSFNPSCMLIHIKTEGPPKRVDFGLATTCTKASNVSPQEENVPLSLGEVNFMHRA